MIGGSLAKGLKRASKNHYIMAYARHRETLEAVSYTHLLWRYMDALPMEWEEDAWKRTTMGEGCTPCIPLSAEQPNLFIKMDFHNPTLSFKDRGGVMLMAQAARLNTPRVIADSSGNAGTSISALSLIHI